MGVDFNASSIVGIAPFEVVFTSIVSGAVLTYSWDFGDNFTSEDQNPSHSYSCPGIYDVTLKIITSNGTETETETETKSNYISVTSDNPQLPKNKCCFGPYSVTCLGCSSGSDTSFYDSSKTFRSCQSAECNSSCEAEFGDTYSVISDYIDECPSCRECYLEHASQTGRHYTLTITNCEVYITEYLAENSCGTCLEEAESFCFSIKTCGDTNKDDPPCEVVFSFDSQIFIVTGETGICGSEIDCGDCWLTPSTPLEDGFSFLPEELDTCEVEEKPQDVDQAVDQEQTEEQEVIWHNKPSDETGLGTTCLEEEIIPSNALTSIADEKKSFRNPAITVMPSGHSVVVYEDMSEIGITKLSFEEKHTSVKNRIVHHRSLGFGRLINSSLTSNETVKFQIYDDITTDADIYADYAIGFSSGPLAGKMYTISNITHHPVTETLVDSTGSLVATYFASIFLDSENKQIYGEEFSFGQRLIRLSTDGSNWVSLDTASGTNIMNFFIDVENNYLYQMRRKDDSTYSIDRAPIGGEWQTEIISISSATTTCTGFDIDLNHGKIYYIKPGEIRRANTDGTGDESILTLSDTYAPTIKVDLTNNKIWWTEFNDGKIRKANLDGSDPITVVSAFAHDPWGFDIANDKIFWSEYKDKVIKYANSDGTSPKTVAGTTNTPRSIRIDPNNNTLYWLEGQHNSDQNPPRDVYPSHLKKVRVTMNPYYEIEFSLSEQVNNA